MISLSKSQTSVGPAQQVLCLLLNVSLHGLPGLLSWLDRCCHPANDRNTFAGGNIITRVKPDCRQTNSWTLVGSLFRACPCGRRVHHRHLETGDDIHAWVQSGMGMFMTKTFKFVWNIEMLTEHCSGNKHLTDNALLSFLLPLLPPWTDHQSVQASATMSRMMCTLIGMTLSWWWGSL